MADGTNLGRITVGSSLLASVGTHAITVKNTATVTANSAFTGGSSFAYSIASPNDLVSFTITIVNPCTLTTLNDITFTETTSSSPKPTKQLTDGTADLVKFVRPTTAAEDGVGPVFACGATTYTLHSDI